MADANLKEAYFQALGVKPGSSEAKKALRRAHEYRTLEIELYWKRAAYFWTFQGAVFAAFGLLLSGQTWEQGSVLLLLCVAGGLTSVTSLFAARGAKFWQENWEKHVDMLEACMEGNLHKTVWLNLKNGSYSVTRLNEVLNCLLLAIWFVLAGVTIYHLCLWPRDWTIFGEIKWLLWIGLLLAVASGFAALFLCTRSRLSGCRFEPSDGKWHGFPDHKGDKGKTVLRRLAYGEEWDCEK